MEAPELFPPQNPPDDSPKPLKLKEPLCTKRHRIKFMARGDGGELVFQSLKSGKIFNTDKFGVYRGRHVVYNGTPDQFLQTPRTDFVAGDIVFIGRPLTKLGRKIFAAEVVREEANRTVVVNVLDRRNYGPVRKTYALEDGSLIVPKAQIYATEQELEEGLAAAHKDFERAKVERRQILETQRKHALQ